MGAGGLRTRTSERFFPVYVFLFSLSFLSPKYIILVNHFFFLNSLMQNSYSDNRCHGVSYYFVRVLLARAHELPRDQRIYNISCLSLRAVSLFPHRNRIFVLRSAALPCALVPPPPPNRPACYNHRCHTDLPLTVALVFRQPPSSLSLVSFFFLFYVHLDVVFLVYFFPLVSSDFHVGEYGLCHIYLTEVGTAISFSASSSSLATSCLFAAPSRRKSENKQ